MSRRRDRRRGFHRLPHGKGWARTLPAGAVHARWVGRSMPCPAAAGAALARTGPTPLAPRRRQVECPMNQIECAPGFATRRGPRCPFAGRPGQNAPSWRAGSASTNPVSLRVASCRNPCGNSPHPTGQCPRAEMPYARIEEPSAICKSQTQGYYSALCAEGDTRTRTLKVNRQSNLLHLSRFVPPQSRVSPFESETAQFVQLLRDGSSLQQSICLFRIISLSAGLAGLDYKSTSATSAGVYR